MPSHPFLPLGVPLALLGAGPVGGVLLRLGFPGLERGDGIGQVQLAVVDQGSQVRRPALHVSLAGRDLPLFADIRARPVPPLSFDDGVPAHP